jgi:IS30 family transposase
LLESPSAPRTRRHPRKQDQTRLEADKISERIQRFQAGGTVYELSETFNVHHQTVSAILKRNNVTLRRATLRENEIDRESTADESYALMNTSPVRGAC